MGADANFRPNAERAIHIAGVFDDALVAAVTPKIIALRSDREKGNDPITVFINSPGGATRCYEIIAGMLRSVSCDREGCRVITVAVGDAGSAAANLLSVGDYAYAYPHSIVHFHGARLSEVEVTMEDASTIVNRLASLNRRTARALAQMMFGRLVHRYVQLRGKFEDLRKEDPDISEAECFGILVGLEIGPVAQRAVFRTLERVKAARALWSKVSSKIDFSQKIGAQDIAVMRAILELRNDVTEDESWRLNESQVAQITADYFLLRDYVVGEHRSAMRNIVDVYGFEFLDDAEFELLNKKEAESKSDADKWLFETTEERIEPFWHFTVLLCRQLQEGENRLSATDAYWLGAVDEVLGTELIGDRATCERHPRPVTADASTNEEKADS